MEGSGQLRAPTTLPPRERDPAYPLDKRLGWGGARAGPGAVVKIKSPFLTFAENRAPLFQSIGYPLR